MTFQIGRASLATHPFQLSHAGDLLTFGIDVAPASVTEAKAIRQQLTGLVEGDVIPVTWSDDSDIDGFYRVISAQVNPVEQYLNSGFMRAVLTLQRVGGGYANALIELLSVFTEDTDVAYGAGSGPFNVVAVPGSALGLTVESLDVGGDVAYVQAITSADGSRVAAYRVPPSAFYEGAATIEMRSGGVWYPVVGRQIPDVAVEDLRLTNGILRVGFERDPAKLTVSRFNGTSFAVTHKWVVPDQADAQINAEWIDGSAVALSNDVTSVALRLLLEQENDADPSFLPLGAVFGTEVVFGLQRGDRGVKASVVRSSKGVGNVDFQYDGPVAATTEQYSATTYTSGHRTTANDADGKRAFAIPGDSPTASTTGLLRVGQGEVGELGVLAPSGEYEFPVLGMKKSDRQRVIT